MMVTNKKTLRKSKNKFIHKSESGWSHCYVTKSDNAIIYISKTKAEERTQNVRLKSYLSTPEYTSASIPIYFNKKIIEVLPKQLIELSHAIEKSRYILDFEDDWDDENSSKYNVDTWRKAITFISKLAIKILKSAGQVIPVPKIYHGPNGSIDIYWDNASFNLLLNFPENGLGSFYGDDYSNNKSEGVFDPSNAVNIFPFLVELK